MTWGNLKNNIVDNLIQIFIRREKIRFSNIFEKIEIKNSKRIMNKFCRTFHIFILEFLS